MSESNHRIVGRPRGNSTEEPVSDVIVRVAGQLFTEYGYEATTVDAVADACHVTKAAVYYYFTSKADLFVCALTCRMDDIRYATSRHLSESFPLYHRLKTVARIRLSMRRLGWDFATLLREAEPYLNDAQRKKMKEADERLIETIAEAFRRAEEAGEIRTLNPSFTAHAYVGLLEVCRIRTVNGNLKFPDNEAAAELVVDSLYNGLLIV